MSKQLDVSTSEVSYKSENMHFLEEIDPSLANGYEIIYDREIPLELRTNINSQQSQEVGSLESIKVKVLIQPMPPMVESDRRYKDIKIEFTSETDLFFFYVAVIDEDIFRQTKKDNELKIDFDQYLAWLIKLFNQCYKEPHNFFGVFHMQPDGFARLDFIENMEYKFLEILAIDFMANHEDQVKQNVIYRYNILKAKMLFVQSRLEDISNLIKLKNPSLLVQIQKNTLGGNLNSSTMRNNANQSKYNPNGSRYLK